VKFANVRELKNKTSEVLRTAEKEAVIITSNGKPRAIVTAISEEDFEDYLLERSPGLMDVLAEARAEYQSSGGLKPEDYAAKRKGRRGKACSLKGGLTMKIADLSPDELKELIGKIIEEKFRELIDPDTGLELREDFVQVLESSIASKERIPFKDVRKKLGLN
jgi:prevent-host-death family protein